MCNSGWCNYGFVIACFLLQLLLKKGKRILNTEQHQNTCNWPFCKKKGFLSHRAGKAQLGFRQQGCSQVTYPAHPGFTGSFLWDGAWGQVLCKETLSLWSLTLLQLHKTITKKTSSIYTSIIQPAGRAPLVRRLQPCHQVRAKRRHLSTTKKEKKRGKCYF